MLHEAMITYTKTLTRNLSSLGILGGDWLRAGVQTTLGEVLKYMKA